MVTKGESVAFLLLVLLSSLVLVSFNVAAVQASTTVTYDYYVVAGYEMTPVPPSPEPSPSGLEFSIDPQVYSFGNITRDLGETWLYEGTIETKWAQDPENRKDGVATGAYATVTITNNVGYDIVITDLTAQVTTGTMTLDFYFPHADEWFGNFSMISVDTLDPWNHTLPQEVIVDECDYTTGKVRVVRDDIDTFRSDEEPGDLLEDDWEGDAKDTGHEAPVELADGATFKEYFGMTVFGDIAVGTQINGTVTLSLTYVDASEFGAEEFPWLWVGIGVVVIVVVVVAVAVAVRRRK